MLDSVMKKLAHASNGEQLEDYDVALLEHLRAEAETTLSHSQDSDSARKEYDSYSGKV